MLVADPSPRASRPQSTRPPASNKRSSQLRSCPVACVWLCLRLATRLLVLRSLSPNDFVYTLRTGFMMSLALSKRTETYCHGLKTEPSAFLWLVWSQLTAHWRMLQFWYQTQ